MYDAFQQVRQIVRQYPFVSMDTEFPGVVARPIGEFNTTSDYQYQVCFRFDSFGYFLTKL
jgi:CCR4-NOT transcription complex subunit 7/8